MLSVLHIYIYIPGKLDFAFLNTVQCYDMLTESSRYGPMVVCGYLCITLPHHHYADLSENIELLKCFSDIFCLEYVAKIRSDLSIIFHAKYGAVCIQLTHFSYYECENTCTRSYYHHQIRSMTHLQLFRVRSWNNGMCCMSFYILLKSNHDVTQNWSRFFSKYISKCFLSWW